MFDLHSVSEFSRAHCISICAFLVPAILVATSVTMIFTALRRPQAQVWQAAGIASIFAVGMILHVFTWFVVGVVMAPTYILLWLGSSCLLTNIGAILLHRRWMQVQQIPPTSP
ncbi:MAG TPA: hypothetical protein DEV81_20995 [Cyanobacteria bacterium UBA11049]|nr:hypothetical protein [Cyanobacteria bacterium UBA11049]